MFILPVIVSAPTRLVNMSFENGVFASISKRARVIILFKGGSQITLLAIVLNLSYQRLLKF